MPRKDRAFAGVATAAVLAVVVLSFLKLGTPSAQRLAALDRVRLENVKALAHELTRAWKTAAPASLQELVSRPDAPPLVLNDPATSQPYEYRRHDGTAHELCATFATDTRRLGGTPSFWDHPKGRYCYALDSKRRPGN